jgi:hypothetical protein
VLQAPSGRRREEANFLTPLEMKPRLLSRVAHSVVGLSRLPTLCKVDRETGQYALKKNVTKVRVRRLMMNLRKT